MAGAGLPVCLPAVVQKLWRSIKTVTRLFLEMKRPEPIPPNIDVGLKATVENKADVLLITDGDADRLGVGDEFGEFVNQLRVYGLLAYYLARDPRPARRDCQDPFNHHHAQQTRPAL